jgi:CheY-like chemotaxis protein
MANLTEVLGPVEKPTHSENTEHSTTERRRRLRTKISAPVRVRMNHGSLQQAEVCTTVDASRDGLLFTTSFAGYRTGMDLAITFPYSGSAGGVKHERTAVVARVFEMPEGRFGIGVRFYNYKRPGAESDEEQAQTAAETMPRKAEEAARELEKPMPLVLIVESEARTRDMLRAVLRSEGYVVEAVANGAGAVEFLRQRTPNLLLTEIEIDDMSGYDLCLIVKSNDRLRNVPVVMTTRSGQPNDYSTAHALGAIVCLAKPYKQERLLHIVRMLAPPTTSEQPAMQNGARRGANGNRPAANPPHANGKGRNHR